MDAKRGRLHHAARGAGPEVGVCLSADTRTNRATPSSASDADSGRRRASLITRRRGNIAQDNSGRAALAPLPCDNTVCRGCHLTEPPSREMRSSPLMTDRHRDATIGKSQASRSPMSIPPRVCSIRRLVHMCMYVFVCVRVPPPLFTTWPAEGRASLSPRHGPV